MNKANKPDKANKATKSYKVFIDGSAGTTGLSIRERLKNRTDVELLTLADEKRKDIDARLQMIYNADVAFLCLPDAAAEEIASAAGNADTVIIDTSTAHRTKEGWVYGLPELKGQRKKIAAAKRIANPGCHATGFIVLTAPLVDAGIIGKDALLSCTSLTGYSGGGKKMIADYEIPAADGQSRDPLLAAPRMYGLSQSHKHLPEMVKYSGLDAAPVFMPIVAGFYSGMEVMVPLNAANLTGGSILPDDIRQIYADYYSDGVICLKNGCDENGFMSANAYSGRDDLEISVSGADGRIVLTARYDNLGKGASGAAIQNMNIALGINETEGLLIG